MLDSLRDAINAMFESEKVRLLRDADEAFNANDEGRCVEAIESLYKILDDELAQQSRWAPTRPN